MERGTPCPVCDGSGWCPEEHEYLEYTRQCIRCGGHGFVEGCPDPDCHGVLWQPEDGPKDYPCSEGADCPRLVTP